MKRRFVPVLILFVVVVFSFFLSFSRFHVLSEEKNNFSYSNSNVCNADWLKKEMLRMGPPLTKSVFSSPPRAAVISILGVANNDADSQVLFNKHLSELGENFNRLDLYFLYPFKMDFVLFFPADVQFIANVTLISFQLDWKELSPPQQLFGTTIYSYFTKLNTVVKVVGRPFPLPHFIQQNLSLLDGEDWLACAGRKHSLSYNLYSGAAFVFHLFFDQVLETYDFTFKVDTDVVFFSQPPDNPIAAMMKRECAFLHTRIWPGNSHHSCQENAYESMVEFSKLSGRQALSVDYEWCKNTDYFYGNLVGLSTTFFFSPAMKLFSKWLYECTRDNGYFRHRWGDQASYPIFLCQWLDIPDIRNNEQICDFSSWRGTVFFHPE